MIALHVGRDGANTLVSRWVDLELPGSGEAEFVPLLSDGLGGSGPPRQEWTFGPMTEPRPHPGSFRRL